MMRPGQQELRSSDEVKWVEVWFDSDLAGDYVLVLRELANGLLELVDPQEGRKVITTFGTYAAAVDWLWEDEYHLVTGRWIYDGSVRIEGVQSPL